jgi:hypothetical protein
MTFQILMSNEPGILALLLYDNVDGDTFEVCSSPAKLQLLILYPSWVLIVFKSVLYLKCSVG